MSDFNFFLPVPGYFVATSMRDVMLQGEILIHKIYYYFTIDEEIFFCAPPSPGSQRVTGISAILIVSPTQRQKEGERESDCASFFS